jgi:hypothetical protein
MFQGTPARELNLEALAAEVAEFLDDVPAGEAIGAKLSRLLHAFLQDEVLPQAERAADLGIDPTPRALVVLSATPMASSAWSSTHIA